MTSSTSEYLFLSFALFASFNEKSLPQQSIRKPECIILPLVLIAAILIGASNKSLGFAG